MVEMVYNSTMGLNIKNPGVEKLAAEVARLANESKTEAIRKALEERRKRLRAGGARASRGERLLAFLEREVWPEMPPDELGRKLTRKQEEKILGYGPHGV
jgi:antitoxin VapB